MPWPMQTGKSPESIPAQIVVAGAAVDAGTMVVLSPTTQLAYWKGSKAAAVTIPEA